jgi:hypothetical protein
MTPQQQNTMVIRDGNPDLIAQFDYMHFEAPNVPAILKGRNLDDPSVSDQQLLTFLGGS